MEVTKVTEAPRNAPKHLLSLKSPAYGGSFEPISGVASVLNERGYGGDKGDRSPQSKSKRPFVT